MAFRSTSTLTSLLKDSEIISPFNPNNIKNGSYEMTLGEQVYLTDSDPKKIQVLEKDEQIKIAPGQFALLLTEETVTMPNNMIGFISIKGTVKFKGLINVSGFHVDPCFKGRLVFSVYNAGPSLIVLSRGTKYFPIWFADIDREQSYDGNHKNQQRIPDDAVESLSHGELASPSALSTRIDKNQIETEKKFGLIEKDQKANNYLAATAFALIATIFLKFIFDWAVAGQNFDRGYQQKQKEVAVDSTIHRLLLEKRQLLQEIDSLKKTIKY